MNVRKLPIACVRSTLDVLLMMNFKMKGRKDVKTVPLFYTLQYSLLVLIYGMCAPCFL